MLLSLVPTAPPRNLVSTNFSSNSSTIRLLQTEAKDLNGVFKYFKLIITENRRNGRSVTTMAHVHVALANSNATHQHAEAGTTPTPIPTTIPTIIPTLTPAASNATSGNITSANSTAANQTWAISKLNLTNNAVGELINRPSDKISIHFMIQLDGLLPYTVYNLSIATCTIVGCGEPALTWLLTQQNGMFTVVCIVHS